MYFGSRGPNEVSSPFASATSPNYVEVRTNFQALLRFKPGNVDRQQFFLVCALLDHRNVQNFVVKPLTYVLYFILNFEHFYAISIISKSIKTCRIVA